MKFRFPILLLLSILIHTDSWSQSNYSESLGQYLIGPENVSWQLEEQKEFYTHYYAGLLEVLDKLELGTGEEVKILREKKRLKKKDKARILLIEEYLELLNEEGETLKSYISLWENLTLNDQWEELSKLHLSKNCFDVISENGAYMREEYELLEFNEANSIYWNEFVDIQFKPLKNNRPSSEPGKEWVKKKVDTCPGNPDDCYVWCLVDIPIDRDSRGDMFCPESFGLDFYELNCTKTVSLKENNLKANRRLKLVDVKSGKEIILVKASEVECP